MFSSIWSKSVWEYRVAILGWGIGLGLLQIIAFSVFSSSGASGRASIVSLAQQTPFLSDPIAVNTAVGYVTWNQLSLAGLLLSIWSILAGARMLRGEEERGTLETLLAVPLTRINVLMQKVFAFALALLLIALLMAACLLIGESSAGVTVDVGRAVLTGLNVSLLAALFGLLALVCSQMFRRWGTAAGLAGTVLILAFTLESVSRLVSDLSWLRFITPFYYYALNKPLIPTFQGTIGAPVVLLVVSLLLLAGSARLFVGRDIGDVAHSRMLRQQANEAKLPADGRAAMQHVQHDRSLRAVGLRALRAHALPVLWWIVGLGVWSVLLTALAQSSKQSLKQFYANNPTFVKLLQGNDVGTNAGYIALAVFTFVPVAVMLYVLTQAGSWVSDLDRGRAELVLSTPLARVRVMLESYLALLVAAILAPCITWLGVLLGAALVGLNVDAGQVAQAAFGFLPLELIVASLVYALGVRLRAGLTLGIVGVYIAFAFFVQLLGSMLNAPDWLSTLSMFHYYGNPLVKNLDWGAALIMVAIAALLLAGGLRLFVGGDIRRGE